jgi:hypothetical protein
MGSNNPSDPQAWTPHPAGLIQAILGSLGTNNQAAGDQNQGQLPGFLGHFDPRFPPSQPATNQEGQQGPSDGRPAQQQQPNGTASTTKAGPPTNWGYGPFAGALPSSAGGSFQTQQGDTEDQGRAARAQAQANMQNNQAAMNSQAANLKNFADSGAASMRNLRDSNEAQLNESMAAQQRAMEDQQAQMKLMMEAARARVKSSGNGYPQQTNLSQRR